MGQVLVEGRPRRHAGLLEFDHHPGQAVDEAHQVGAAGIEAADHAELADQQEVVLLRVFPVHHAQSLGLLSAVLAVGDGDGDAVFQQPVDLAVRGLQTHRRAVAGQFVGSGLDRLGRQAGIEFDQCRPHSLYQHHLALGLAAKRAASSESLFHRRHRLPGKRRKQPDGGLLDELVFGVGVGAHGFSFLASG